MSQKNNDQYSGDLEKYQYLTFLLSGELFALEVLQVKEIISYGMITPIPTMPSYVLGVINVRGDVVPIISLAKRFELKPSKETIKTCIIIVSVKIEDELLDVGMVVDMVNQVYTILPENIEQTPMFGTMLRKDFIKQIAKVDKKFISVLEIEGIVSLQEITNEIGIL